MSYGIGSVVIVGEVSTSPSPTNGEFDLVDNTKVHWSSSSSSFLTTGSPLVTVDVQPYEAAHNLLLRTKERNPLDVALSRSHQISVKVKVIDSTGSVIHDNLLVEGGNVQIDGNNAIRRTCNVRLYDSNGNMTPSDANDLLHPLSGNELVPYYGIVTGYEIYDDPYVYFQGDGSGGQNKISTTVARRRPVIEEFQLGVFKPYAVDITDSGENLNIGIDGYDRANKVQRSRLLEPYIVEAGTPCGQAIKALLSFKVPGLKYKFEPVTVPLPELRFGSSGDQGGGDTWDYAKQMAESIGHELYFDSEGAVVLKRVRDPRQLPIAAAYIEGEQARFMSLQRRLSTQDTYNHVMASGQTTSEDTPARAHAVDDNPNSPTYIGNPWGNSSFGDIPFFLNSQYIATDEQAQLAADAKLNQLLGNTENINITAITDPRHEAGDIVEIKRERARVDYSYYVLEKANVNLAANITMNITVRERRV
jgi:hypothetical protein